MSKINYITTIGMEIHLQLLTKTKAFCGCVNEFGRKPNTAVCPVCLGLPGSLPVLNKEYLYRAIKTALALNCKVSGCMKFDRKNYFYPDIPKNYQISQYDRPLSKGGFLDIITEEGRPKRIGITRVHMEEDAGKLMHDEIGIFSFIDLNRAGMPLLEIVSEPDISSPEEAHVYLKALKSVLEYLDVSDCNMEEGSLRCDANISIRPEGEKKLGVKVELKNMNSFRATRQALEYEQQRQANILSKGENIVQQTRLWNEKKKITEVMRTKEEAHDYRYFPDPDLPDFIIDEAMIESIRESLPEMPQIKQERFQQEYGLSAYNVSVLATDKLASDFFEQCVKLYAKPKPIANWIIGELHSYLNEKNIPFEALSLKPQQLTKMLELIDKGVISNKMAKDVLWEILASGKGPEEIVQERGFSQITDRSEIERLAREVLNENPKVRNDYISGKKNALGFLVGQLMKKTQGKANPAIVNEALRGIIEEKKA
jgi:aspartyl-tRNA(Asn)/glutamyl-tRNA(Gln) amidotransferase subunit B